MKKIIFADKVRVKVFDGFSNIGMKKVCDEEELDNYMRKIKEKLR